MPTKSRDIPVLIYLNKENYKFVETNNVKLSKFVNDILKLMRESKAKKRFIKLYADR